MAVSCGLLSADWGNIADWATVAIAGLALVAAIVGVVVSALGALAVAYLGWQANSLASSAVRDERKRAEQEDALQASERRLLLVTLSGPIGLAAVALMRTSSLLRRSPHTNLADPTFRRHLIDGLRASTFEIPESVRSRIHLVGEPHGSMIMRALATPRSLEAMIGLVAEGPDSDITAEAYGALTSGVSTALRDLTMVQEQIALAVKEAGIPPPVKREAVAGTPPATDGQGNE